MDGFSLGKSESPVSSRQRLLQGKGYFKAKVKASTQQLPDQQHTHQFLITLDIDAGSQYRLGYITFRNNRVITNGKALRGLFPIKDGDILKRETLAKGLENLRYVYQEFGYLNFAAVPATTFDDEGKRGFLEIDVDEGTQFYVSSIDIVGADAKVLNDLALRSGQIYNRRLVELFLRKQLPGAKVNDLNIQHQVLNERDGTVALTFNFPSRPH